MKVVIFQDVQFGLNFIEYVSKCFNWHSRVTVKFIFVFLQFLEKMVIFAKLAFFDSLDVHCASGLMSCLKSTTLPLMTWIHSRLRTLFRGDRSQIKKDSLDARNLENWSGRLHRCINRKGERVWTPNIHLKHRGSAVRERGIAVKQASWAWTYP